MATFRLEIVTPTRVIEDLDITYVRCPGEDGSFGIMAHHADAIIALGVGELKVSRGREDRYYATSGGYTEITQDKVLFLLETAEQSDEIDVDRAESSLKRARERISTPEGTDLERVESSLVRALNRLHVAKR